jgi:hypothetical protein
LIISCISTLPQTFCHSSSSPASGLITVLLSGFSAVAGFILLTTITLACISNYHVGCDGTINGRSSSNTNNNWMKCDFDCHFLRTSFKSGPLGRSFRSFAYHPIESDVFLKPCYLWVHLRESQSYRLTSLCGRRRGIVQWDNTEVSNSADSTTKRDITAWVSDIGVYRGAGLGYQYGNEIKKPYIHDLGLCMYYKYSSLMTTWLSWPN